MADTLLYVVRPGERNELLRYSLRSIATHWPDSRVVIAGHKPDWVGNVTHIPITQRRVDRRNVVRILRAACAHGAVPERFVLMNDDFITFSPVVHTPPLVCSGTVRELATHKAWQVGHYGTAMANTMELLNSWSVQDPIAYDRVHRPMPVLRDIMGEVLYRAGDRVVLHRTLYGNMVADAALTRADAKIRKPNEKLPKDGWVSMSSRAWHTTPGARVRSAFPGPCAFER